MDSFGVPEPDCIADHQAFLRTLRALGDDAAELRADPAGMDSLRQAYARFEADFLTRFPGQPVEKPE